MTGNSSRTNGGFEEKPEPTGSLEQPPQMSGTLGEGEKFGAGIGGEDPRLSGSLSPAAELGGSLGEFEKFQVVMGSVSTGNLVFSVFGRVGSVIAMAGDYTAALVTNAVDMTQAYADPAWITSLAWAKITGAPPFPVTSVFGRTGAITAQPGDYTAAMVTNAVDSTQSYADPSWITSLAWSKITGAPPVGVSSVFGRTGAVTAQAGDYSAAMVTNAVDSSLGYADPSWITSLSWSKIIGAPPAPVSSVFGRTGAVTAQAGDYTAAMVTNAVNQAIGYADPTWITSLSWSKITGAPVIPTTFVSSAFGRTGAVVSAVGDYTAAQITNAVDQTASYSNPAWIVSLPWSKITGVPPTGVSSVFGRNGAVLAQSGDYTAAQVTNAVDITSRYADPAWLTALSWSKIIGAPAVGVSSVFGRTGAVVALTGDYTASMITNAVDQTVGYANPAWITSLAWSKITGAPAIPVTSVFGRTGAVVAANGDYTAAMVTNAVDTTKTYADPAWITSLSWSKIVGAPTTSVSSVFGRSGAVLAVAGDYTAAQITNAVDQTQLYANPSWLTTLAWSKITGAPATGVSSVFGRTGAVVAASGDYLASQVTNAVDATQQYFNPAWIQTLAWSKITGAPTPGVLSVFGRTGAVVQVAGDYTAAQITNAVDQTVSYTNPSWIQTLAWSKITGAPAPPVSSVFGRTGAIAAQTGDYTAAQVTNAVDSTARYADPVWITALSWSKILGAPPSGVSSVFGRTGAIYALPGDYSASQVTNAVDQTASYADPAWITSLSWAKITGAPANGVNVLHGGTQVAFRNFLNFADTVNASWTIADDPTNNRVNISVMVAASGGGLADPTTTLGDLLVRGAAAVQRLGVGSDGQVLTADSSQLLGVKWDLPGSAPVISVFGRTGAITAQAGDYDVSQITNAVSSLATYADPAWITSLSWSKITGAPAIPVTSVFGRTGAIVATSGDYTAAQVTNAVDSTGAYANPAWITSLAWSKITGVPAAPVGSVFGRTGAVIAAVGDYTAAEVTNAVDSTASYADPSWITSLSWSKITGAPPSGVTSVFGRTGTVVAVAGDYSAAQITNAVDATQAYANPAWITSLPWSKITGAPSGITPGGPSGSVQINNNGAFAGYASLTFDGTTDDLVLNPGTFYVGTPFTGGQGCLGLATSGAKASLTLFNATTERWLISTEDAESGSNSGSNLYFEAHDDTGNWIVDALFIKRANGYVGMQNQDAPAYPLDVGGDINISGTYRVNGVPLSTGGGGAVSSVFTRTGAVVAVAGDYTAAMVTNAVDVTQTYANPAWISSLAWSKITGAPAAPVASVFGRTGAVVAVAGDYSAAQVTNAVDQTQTYADPSWLTSLAWSKIVGAPAAPVSSVFGRTGAVVAAAGDYTAAMVTNAVSTIGSYPDPAWITSLSWSKITGAPAAPVTSVFGRTGAVVAAVGDYTAAEVTNAVSTISTYADPSWITSLSWSKIAGAPSVGSYQTPWLQNIAGAGYTLSNPGKILVNTSTDDGSNAPLQVNGKTNIGGQFNADILNVGGNIATFQNATFSTLRSMNYSGSSANIGFVLAGRAARGSVGAPAALQAGDAMLFLQGYAHDGTGWQTCAEIYMDTANNVTAGVAYGRIHFSTNPGGTNLVERMQITAAGLIGINNTSPAYQVDIGGDVNVTGAYRVNGVPITVDATILPIRAVSVSTTMSTADYTVVATAVSVTITLPSSPATGKLVNVKNGNPTAGQLITVAAPAGVLIDESSTVSLGATASLHAQYDGTQWRIL